MADRELAQQTTTAVPRALIEWLVCLLKGRMVLDLFFRQRIDATRADLCDVDAQLVASVDYIEHTQNVGPHRLDFVVLAPVGISNSTSTGAVNDSSGLVLDEFAVRRSTMQAKVKLCSKMAHLTTSSRLKVLAWDMTIVLPCDRNMSFIWLAIIPLPGWSSQLGSS